MSKTCQPSVILCVSVCECVGVEVGGGGQLHEQDMLQVWNAIRNALFHLCYVRCDNTRS